MSVCLGTRTRAFQGLLLRKWSDDLFMGVASEESASCTFLIYECQEIRKIIELLKTLFALYKTIWFGKTITAFLFLKYLFYLSFMNMLIFE